MTYIFIIILFLIVYTHIIYPSLLKRIKIKTEKELIHNKSTRKDKVAIFISAYNESEFIERKLINLKNLTYENKIIYIYDDKSTDNTLSLINEFIEKHKCKDFIVIENKENKGKLFNINQFNKETKYKYKYSILSDVSAIIEPDTIERLLYVFDTKEDVGAVTTTYFPNSKSKDVKYWEHQRGIKQKEEFFGSVLGAHGSCYMIKNKYFNLLQDDVINDDFIIAANVIKHNKKVAYSNIPSLELQEDTEEIIMNRRIRIGAGNLQQLFYCSYLLNAFKRPLIALNFFSVKVLRTLFPFMYLTLLIISMINSSNIWFYLYFILNIVFIIYVVLANKNKIPNKYISETILYISNSYFFAFKGMIKLITLRKINNWYTPTKNYYRLFFKRVFDIILSCFLLTLFLPILLIAMILIKIESPKSKIFFKQKRVGLVTDSTVNEFNIIKLRTMIDDAEKETGAVFAKKNDKRITKIGGFLRKTRIDEIPQFLNVINNDMSIIGPRPERMEIIQKFKKEYPDFINRTYYQKPGITGLSQVEMGYNESVDTLAEKMKYDECYKKEQKNFFKSFLLDILILLKTIKIVLRMEGI